MGFKRKHSRIEVGRKGRIQRGSLSAACTVLDVSESGVRIESRLFVKAGETLQLVIDLDDGQTLSCRIQPLYVQAPRFGARITSITEGDQERLSRLFDERVQRMYSGR
ncbi:MAG TPA: PilZ domain-containing protein [Nitrospira sp.]|nr:PilZ domain-containing protein [Nitrospira sp.]